MWASLRDRRGERRLDSDRWDISFVQRWAPVRPKAAASRLRRGAGSIAGAVGVGDA